MSRAGRLINKLIVWLKSRPQVDVDNMPDMNADTARNLPSHEENKKWWFSFKIKF
jgi:hypothetical protein